MATLCTNIRHLNEYKYVSGRVWCCVGGISNIRRILKCYLAARRMLKHVNLTWAKLQNTRNGVTNSNTTRMPRRTNGNANKTITAVSWHCCGKEKPKSSSESDGLSQ